MGRITCTSRVGYLSCSTFRGGQGYNKHLCSHTGGEGSPAQMQ